MHQPKKSEFITSIHFLSMMDIKVVYEHLEKSMDVKIAQIGKV